MRDVYIAISAAIVAFGALLVIGTCAALALIVMGA